ncbi:MAG TPA: hypothetical protein VFU12_09945 [Glycomyces sp.]|nr:hypothetical protein [Glycomyces sp.]
MAEQTSAPDAGPCTGCGDALAPRPDSPLRCPSCGTEQHRWPGRRVVDRDWASVAGAGGPEELAAPFAVDRVGAQRALRAWVRGRRFAPRRFKRLDRGESLMGLHLPYWVWEAETCSYYSGERGHHRWRVDGAGRRFRRTRWEAAAGTVAHSFTGVAVPATTRLPRRLLPEPALEGAAAARPEDRRHAMPSDVDPEVGLAEAKLRMDELVGREVRRGIGGDEQRVRSIDTEYAALGYRLLLVPVWLSVYAAGGRSRQVVVCGRTGRVAGERPRSAGKVAAAVALPLIVTLIALVFLFSPV